MADNKSLTSNLYDYLNTNIKDKTREPNAFENFGTLAGGVAALGGLVGNFVNSKKQLKLAQQQVDLARRQYERENALEDEDRARDQAAIAEINLAQKGLFSRS